MKKTFTLYSTFEESMDRETFFEAKEEYCKSIRDNSFSMLENDNLIELIKTIKRTPDQIGPYQDLTPFEALNRIGSDLVLLAGAEKLFNNEIKSIQPTHIKLNMGNKAGEDVIITTKNEKIYGEAFNAAKSFCKVKMRQSIDKLLEGKKKGDVYKQGQAVVFYNADIKKTIELYDNQKDKLCKEVTIHRIDCDYEKVVDFKI